jgi:hypothetical protein
LLFQHEPFNVFTLTLSFAVDLDRSSTELISNPPARANTVENPRIILGAKQYLQMLKH